MWVFQVGAARVPTVQLDIHSSPPLSFTRAADLARCVTLMLWTCPRVQVLVSFIMIVYRSVVHVLRKWLDDTQAEQYLDNNHKLGFNILHDDSAIYHSSLKFLHDEYTRYFLFVCSSVTLHFIFSQAARLSLSFFVLHHRARTKTSVNFFVQLNTRLSRTRHSTFSFLISWDLWICTLGFNSNDSVYWTERDARARESETEDQVAEGRATGEPTKHEQRRQKR